MKDMNNNEFIEGFAPPDISRLSRQVYVDEMLDRRERTQKEFTREFWHGMGDAAKSLFFTRRGVLLLLTIGAAFNSLFNVDHASALNSHPLGKHIGHEGGGFDSLHATENAVQGIDLHTVSHFGLDSAPENIKLMNDPKIYDVFSKVLKDQGVDISTWTINQAGLISNEHIPHSFGVGSEVDVNKGTIAILTDKEGRMVLGMEALPDGALVAVKNSDTFKASGVAALLPLERAVDSSNRPVVDTQGNISLELVGTDEVVAKIAPDGAVILLDKNGIPCNVPDQVRASVNDVSYDTAPVAPTPVLAEATPGSQNGEVVSTGETYSGWIENQLDIKFKDEVSNLVVDGITMPKVSIELDDNAILSTGIKEVRLTDIGVGKVVLEYLLANDFYHGDVPHKTFEKPTDADRTDFIKRMQAGNVTGMWMVNDLQTPGFDEKPVLLQVFGKDYVDGARAINNVRIIFVNPDHVDGNVKITDRDTPTGFSVNLDGDTLVFFIASDVQSRNKPESGAILITGVKEYIRFNNGNNFYITSIDKNFKQMIKNQGLTVK